MDRGMMALRYDSVDTPPNAPYDTSTAGDRAARRASKQGADIWGAGSRLRSPSACVSAEGDPPDKGRHLTPLAHGWHGWHQRALSEYGSQ